MNGELKAPRFGEWIRGNFASEQNPQRDGMYVRTIRHNGVWYELTDGAGKFWRYEAKDTTRRPTPAPGALPELPEAVAFCEGDNPCNRDAFAWPGIDRHARFDSPLYTADQMHAYARAYAEQCRAGVVMTDDDVAAWVSDEALRTLHGSLNNGSVNCCVDMWARKRDGFDTPLFIRPSADSILLGELGTMVLDLEEKAQACYQAGIDESDDSMCSAAVERLTVINAIGLKLGVLVAPALQSAFADDEGVKRG